jgi:hypothetical protein
VYRGQNNGDAIPLSAAFSCLLNMVLLISRPALLPAGSFGGEETAMKGVLTWQALMCIYQSILSPQWYRLSYRC